jgi:hypothetical protein
MKRLIMWLVVSISAVKFLERLGRVPFAENWLALVLIKLACQLSIVQDTLAKLHHPSSDQIIKKRMALILGQSNRV